MERISPITESAQNLIVRLRNGLRELDAIDFIELEKEIHVQSKQFINKSDTILFISTFFKPLFKWKEGINSIEKLIESVEADVIKLPGRFNSRLSVSDQSALLKIYTTIAVRLHHLKHDYRQLCTKFLNEVKANEQKTTQKTETPLPVFKLNPDFTDIATLYLNVAIDKQYLLPVDPQKPVSKTDILHSISGFLGCQIAHINPQDNSILNPQKSQNDKSGHIKPLSDYLLHTQPALLAERIKTVFNIEKGKSIRLLIKALEENQPALITVANRNFKAVYLALKETLGRDIGSYQSVKGYTYDPISAKPDYDAICQKLTHILTTLESGQIS
jgi:hypothetical protein